MTPILLASLVTTLLALSALVLPPIGLRVSQLVGFPPLTILASIQIPRHADNLVACVTLDGTMFLDGCWQLDGEHSPVVFARRWIDLPSGEYRGQARLQRGRKVLYSNILTIRVVGDGGL